MQRPSRKLSLKECYEILKIDKHADLETLKSAYRKRAFELHPDLHPDNPDAGRQFQRLNEAYVALSAVLKPAAEKAAQGKDAGAEPKANKAQEEKTQESARQDDASQKAAADDAADKSDEQRYQTVYAKTPGAVAAPTAGLHFTEEVIEALKKKGIQIVFVTLHVGAGTFQPVRVEKLSEHVMHSEWYTISEETAKAVNQAKKEGRRVVSVGTTSLRALESAAVQKGVLQAGARDTRLFIKPGYEFKIIDALITNFHLPKSTLLMLVSALAGKDRIDSAYQYAIKEHYRFFSYGDAMLLEKKPE